LPGHREWLQTDRPARSANEHIGTDTDAERNVATRSDEVSSERPATDPARPRQDDPSHDATGGDSKIKTEASDAAKVTFTVPALIRGKPTIHALARTDD
jgi:hypothetical protein